jgi:hypothetical protein
MKKELARAIHELVDHYTRRLVANLRVVEENGTEQERQAYVRGLGQVLGYMPLDDIYREHPELEPEELRDVDIPPIENAIAIRELWTRDDHGNTVSLPVLLAAPTRNEPTGRYECHYEIRGLSRNKPSREFGDDPMAALMAAIHAIAQCLEWARKRGKKIWWHEESDRLQDLGFHWPNLPRDQERERRQAPMDKNISRDIAAVAEEYGQKLRETLETLRSECTKEEFDRYTGGIGQVLEHLERDMLAPIYREHPDLRPSGGHAVPE